jgi:hypothetical protein
MGGEYSSLTQYLRASDRAFNSNKREMRLLPRCHVLCDRIACLWFPLQRLKGEPDSLIVHLVLSPPTELYSYAHYLQLLGELASHVGHII